MIYLVFINILGFIMGIDKVKAKKLILYFWKYHVFIINTKYIKFYLCISWFIVFAFIQISRQDFWIWYNTNVLSEGFDPHC